MLEKKSFVMGFAAACLSLLLVQTGYTAINIAAHKIPENKKIDIIQNLIDKNFVEDKDIDELSEYMYAGLVAGLDDRYSTYMTAEQFSAFREGLEGSYRGIGIKIFMTENGQMEINEVYAESPAEKAGLVVGDIIYKVNDIEIKDIDSYKKAVAYIKDSKDSCIFYGKHSSTDKFEAVITPEAISVPTVSHCMAGDVGYIRISEFEANTAKAFDDAVGDLEGMKGLIIDLRNNPGGFLNVVNEIADKILPEGTITYIEDKNGNKKYYESDTSCMDMPIVVLVNSKSASASEVLTGAIKDFDSGVIVGTTTYGKGVVQDTFRLRDGSAVKLTTAKYYTPNGECIHGKGITPDYEVFAPEAFVLPNLRSAEAQIDTENDVQLKKALEILNKEI